MAEMRTAIIEGRFEQFRAMVHQIYPERSKDEEGPRQGGRGQKRGGKKRTNKKKKVKVEREPKQSRYTQSINPQALKLQG